VFAFLFVIAIEMHHHSRWLVADGAISQELVADPHRWIAQREAFIRAHAVKGSRLPVVYRLDEDFVVAAKTHQSIEVVDDCNGKLCGVATDELVEDWDEADLRALGVAAPKRDPVRRLVATGGTPAIRGATVSVVNRIERHLIANDSKRVFSDLKAMGFNTVSLIPFAGIRDDQVIPFNRHPAGETDLSMRLAAARAHALGMQVMLKPHVWPHGGDATKYVPPSWETFFASYERYVLHEAGLAERMGAEWFCIGTELSRSEGRPEWRSLIAKVRAVYRGRITYAANFDAFEKTPFWNELDAIGVDAYFPLSPNEGATDGELRAGARAAVERMQRVSRAAHRSVILTELGYPSTAASWIEPWAEHRERMADASAQTRCFSAMLSALRGSTGISGFIIWKYESDPAYTDEKGYLPKARRLLQITP